MRKLMKRLKCIYREGHRYEYITNAKDSFTGELVTAYRCTKCGKIKLDFLGRLQ